MDTKTFLKNFYIICIIWIALPFGSAAQQIHLTSILDGSKGQFAVDSSITTIDTLYYDASFNNKLIKPYYVKNIITLRVNEDAVNYLGIFSDTLSVQVVYKAESEQWDSTTISLVLNYNPDTTYILRSSFVFSGAHSVRVKILDISGDTALNKMLMLENEMVPYRQFTFDCDLSTPAPLSILNSTADELTVGWPNVLGTDEPDLEWAFIDSSALANFQGAGNSWNISKIFDNNATRITIAGYSYSIPLLFSGSGSVFARVRPVQYIGTKRVTGKWSSEYFSNGLLKYDIVAGHEQNINWQSDISFAEDGKRKAVVQYYDGSLRQRQTVTKDNSIGNTVVAETMYDYQGRPVINVMPAPTLNSVIQYSRNFNIGLNGAEYDKTKYDVLSSTTGFCDQHAGEMDSTNGASYYYSSNIQPQLNENDDKFIPDAYNYPFSETEYTADNTGRIKRQGGVGPDFQLGSGHETKYYYAITPDQNELDALFGTEAGDHTHYFKNAVQDANGQISVSYVDMHGRTIATALSGDPSNSPSMSPLDSYTPMNVTETIADATTNVTKGVVMESHKSLLVTKSGLHTFHYNLNPLNLSLENCKQETICYSCLYDLTITITDDCNNQHLPDQKPYILTIKNFKLDSIINDCNANVIDTTFNLQLPIGNYEITKTLSLSEAGENFSRDSLFIKDNTCKTLQDFEQQQRNLLPQGGSCTVSCESCLAGVGSYNTFKKNYIQKVLGGQDSTAYITIIHQAYDDAIAACNQYCRIESSSSNSMRDAMLLDVTPSSGQYADPNNIDSYSIFATDVYDRGLYQNLSGYKDENGKSDTIFNRYNNTYKLPQQLFLNDFLDNFKPSWAKTLLKLHPEKCKLDNYESHLNSYNWNTRAQNIKTYAEASSAGYTDPFNNPQKDPLTSNSSYYTSLNNAYAHYTDVTINNNGTNTSYALSMWDFAKLLVLCPANETSCTYNFIVNNHRTLSCVGDSNQAWVNFINLYIAKKNELLNNYYFSLACSKYGGSGFVYASDLIAAGHTLNFNTYNAASENTILNGYNSTDTNYLKNKVQADMQETYQNTCNNYRSVWTKQLAPGYIESDINAILPQLVAVCVMGSDQYHPLGSRDISKDSFGVTDEPNVYRSFDDVINTYNAGHGYTTDLKHNADLLTAPLPYYSNIAYDKPMITNPNASECSKINAYYQQFGLHKANQSETFSQYLQRTTGTKISDADLTVLLSGCNTSGSCNFISRQVSLPPIFQQNTGSSCIGCVEMDSLYQLYQSTYNNPSYKPKTAAPNDTTQRKINELFTNFMNNRLGFNLATADYLGFMASRATATSGQSSTIADTFHFSVKAPYEISLSDYNLVFANGVAHIPPSLDQPYDNDSWDAGTTFSKNDTLCTGNNFSIVTRVKELQSDRGAILYDALIGFRSDSVNLQLNFIQPVDSLPGASPLEYAGYSFSDNDTAYTKKYDSLFARKMNNWTEVKIKAVNNTLQISVNDTLIESIPYSGFINRITKLYCTFKGADGYIDYFKVYDQYNDLQYSEEFEDCYQSPSNYPPAFICVNSPCDSMSNAITDFQCYKASLEDSAVFKGYCGQTYWGISGTNDYINITSDSNPVNFIQNGELKFPGSMDSLWFAKATFSPVRNFSAHNNYTFEFRIKNPIEQCTDESCVNADFSFDIATNSINQNSSDPDEDFFFVISPVSSRAHYNYRHVQYASTALNRALNNWTTVKLKATDAAFNIFINDTLILVVNRDGLSFIDKIGRFFFTFYGRNQGRALDWVKMYEPVNNIDQLIYFENFNNAEVPARPNVSFLVPPAECTALFTNFYNEKYDTDYSYNDLSNKYYNSCGKALNVCNKINPTLCKKSATSYPPATIDTVNNCTDSIFFIKSISIERYKYYKDSLNNIFDSLYRQKCLQAYNFETFTVSHTLSEYHYTLYFYDQAGNLLQTIPPKAVMPNWNAGYLAQVKIKRAANDTLRPAHKYGLSTRYAYNTLNQVNLQKTPDAGSSSFYYDRLGRLVLSQNAKQATGLKYSYTTYDQLGRIVEVGELTGNNPITAIISRNPVQLENWLSGAADSRTQITQTVYDEIYQPFIDLPTQPPLVQRNMRNRVSYTKVFNNVAQMNDDNYTAATFYSYDIHGNVDTLLQDYKQGSMYETGNQYKKIVYKYDLISGKVNAVAYQPNKPEDVLDYYSYHTDAFYQRYSYDAENRLTNVETSADSIYWENDAYYKYYRHGPLARSVIGQQKVQGIDYAYTLQGWLKGVNSTMPATIYDMGVDGQPSLNISNASVARDAFGFALYYYGAKDYHPAATTVTSFADAGTALGNAFKPLYNGNIAAMTESITAIANPLTFNYSYDQLNRLVQMKTYRNANTTNNILSPVAIKDFSENIKYDASGNILNYTRYGNSTNTRLTNAKLMDSLTYNYDNNTNKLNFIREIVGNDIYLPDIDKQNKNNYSYDFIGNLIKDVSGGILNIEWTVYGKIKTITKTDNTTINYSYDAAGNRISKIITGSANNNGETWYVRDASGNVLTTYTINNATINSGDPTISEVNIYGSSRLGMYRPNYNIYYGGPEIKDMVQLGYVGYYLNFYRGMKNYELTNHLGNVLATVTDNKIPVVSGSSINYFNPKIINAQEYYPFGMQMPGRTFAANSSSTYRYGMNGQEKSSELNDNLYTAEFWQYDARIGRRWNLDPKPTIGISPYAAFNNNPIFYSDPFGDTTVTGAGGGQSVDIDEKTNSLQFYNSASYNISGTNTKVPAQAGQLRSFSNGLGTFSAKWSIDANGAAVFAGYKNENNQTVNDVVKEVNGWKYRAVAWLANFGNSRLQEYNANPVVYNIKLTTTMLAIGAVGAVEPAPYIPGYNPSVTLSEGFEGISIASLARAGQGTGIYPGIDVWRNITLKEGTQIAGGLPGQSEFYTTMSGLNRSNLSGNGLWQGLQVGPSAKYGYRPLIGIYRVTNNTKAAFGTTYANPQFGPGGLPQIFVPKSQDLQLIKTIPLK